MNNSFTPLLSLVWPTGYCMVKYALFRLVLFGFCRRKAVILKWMRKKGLKTKPNEIYNVAFILMTFSNPFEYRMVHNAHDSMHLTFQKVFDVNSFIFKTIIWKWKPYKRRRTFSHKLAITWETTFRYCFSNFFCGSMASFRHGKMYFFKMLYLR